MSENTTRPTLFEFACQYLGTCRYHYKPLSHDRAIRLVRFMPGDELKCELVEAEDIESAPRYIAISYTWGTDVDSMFILLGGQVLPISKSLHDVLEHCAGTCTRNKALLWADAICINQDDLEERSKQVLLMKELYEQAWRVQVWLGLAADDSDLAIDTMMKWCRELDKRTASSPSGGGLFNAIQAITPADEVFYGPRGSQIWKAWIGIQKLCQRPWWRRVWILQESTGPAETELRCGLRTLEWTALFIVTQIASRLANYPGLEPLRGFADHNMSALTALKTARENPNERCTLGLLQLLQQARRCYCKDPRDRVYAMMGLALDVKQGDIVPDYEADVKSVFLEVVNLVLHKYPDGHHLDFLAYVVSPIEGTKEGNVFEENFPSWLPDWRTLVIFRELPKFLEKEMEASEPAKVYNASLGATPVVSITEDIMSVFGFSIDTIASIGEVHRTRGADRTRLVNQEARTFSNTAYPTGGTHYEAYLHTIIADFRGTSGQAYERNFAVDFSLLECDIESLAEKDAWKQYQMRGQILSVPAGRRIGTTQKGFLVLAPAAAQIGDTLCCFYGGQVLYCVRSKRDGNYAFLGECYVHGLMDGEALKYRQSDEVFKLV